MIVQKNFIVKEETFERELFGNFDENIKLIEDTLKIDVILRGKKCQSSVETYD